METYDFVETVYKHYGNRAINSLYNKCMEVLDVIEMGLPLHDHQGNTIEEFKMTDKASIKKLREHITKQVIRNFLGTKEVYQIISLPRDRKTFIKLDGGVIR